ncbi:ribonuclease III [Cyanobacterium stanieri LEGE 03274]|uniref:Ribonuclease 3 n=1 Tax=Cyanobacterium stanieri LEGE 03274 TaxID=1828756 RepID=A0ABR9V3A7_9CHRO|nr:ribonuclease III [Cyanobacterium stanieri]MBE9221284.1 ribonuclease III [Cyanobacterium stanieri LEGE 03274]
MTITDPRRRIELQKLLKKLGLTDLSQVNWTLLDTALTHSSFSHENNYEQLEFVGDAVVRLVAAELLKETYPTLPVGEYAAIRSVIVSDRFLAEIAELYGIETYLLIAPNVRGDRMGRISRLADAFEAILGALYESTKTMELIRYWLDPVLSEKAAQVHADPARQNYKDALQEWTQRVHKSLPTYVVQEHRLNKGGENERFLAQVWLKDQLLGEGKGATKKASHQAAAKQAFYTFVNQEQVSPVDKQR